MNEISPTMEEALLRKGGYSESAIKIYKDLKAMPFKAFDGQKLAEAFLLLLDVEKEKAAAKGASERGAAEV